MKKMILVQLYEYNLVDAFVAMGGNTDKSGTVDANLLI